MIEAATTLALLHGSLILTDALYIGFVGLQRTGEILGVHVRQVVWSADKRQVVPSLPISKGSKLTNVIADPLAVRFFHLLTFSRASF